MLEITLITVALASLGWCFFWISKRIQAWILRREIKRLKTDFAKLQGSVLQLEKMKSAVTDWRSKNALTKCEPPRKV
jgi:Tfp pilus assembly protein PilO